MPHHIERRSIASAWLEAMEYLVKCPDGKAVNLAVTVAADRDPEPAGLPELVDDFVRPISGRPSTIQTVANTIFPNSLYLPQLGDDAAAHLYEHHQMGRSVRNRIRGRTDEHYFDRLVAWPGTDRLVNQLDVVISRMKSSRMSSAYELAMSDPERQPLAADDYASSSADLRIYNPSKDHQTRGFPCLSHISLTKKSGVLHMTAMYRNQAFLRKAYGNLLGLSSLLKYISDRCHLEPGELMCVASHADAEIGTPGCGKRAVATLLKRCRTVLAGEDGNLALRGPVKLP
jgi:hypothetical protein